MYLGIRTRCYNAHILYGNTHTVILLLLCEKIYIGIYQLYRKRRKHRWTLTPLPPTRHPLDRVTRRLLLLYYYNSIDITYII